MNAPTKPTEATDPPMAEPGKRRTGGDVARGADPRTDLAGKAAPGSAPGAAARPDRPESDDRATPAPHAQRGSGSGASDAAASRENDPDDEDEWRHEPVAPVDEPNPLKSLGQAVGETVTGADADATRRKR